MADAVSKTTRSGIMRQIKGKNTGPERLARSALHRAGFRFTLHRRDLPGSPDIVLPGLKIVIFVHGCFWHGCRWHCRMPKSRTDYWNPKIARNKVRDRKVRKLLRDQGWRVYRIWEHSLKQPHRVVSRFEEMLASGVGG